MPFSTISASKAFSGKLLQLPQHPLAQNLRHLQASLCDVRL
jgi:hypothetical protein